MRDAASNQPGQRSLRAAGAWAALLLGLLLIANLIIPHAIILPSFRDLERQEAEKDMARCLDAVARELETLATVTKDYGTWDDTYAFVESRDPAYIEDNLRWEYQEKQLHNNLVCIVDDSGKVVWGEAMDSAHGGAQALPPFPAALLSAPPSRGLLLTAHTPLLIASHAIVKSSGQGPSRGTMVLGRYLSPARLQSLSDQAHVSFRVDAPAAAAGPCWPLDGAACPRAEHMFFDGEDEEVARISSCITDLTGTSRIRFTADHYRPRV